MTRAFYFGFSDHITATVANGGDAITKRHHPNIYVADDGWMTRSATAATYEATIADALGDLDAAATDARAMNADLLNYLRSDMIKKRIQPTLKKDGKMFWLMKCHPDVMAQARNDSKIMEATKSAYQSGKLDHPLLNSTELFYNGFCLSEDISIGIEVHQTGNTSVTYGPVSTGVTELNGLQYYESTNAADQNLKVSAIIGEASLGVGQVNGMDMIVKDGAHKDYGRKSSVGATMIVGAARMEKYDNIASPTAVQNFASAVIATNSPPQSA